LKADSALKELSGWRAEIERTFLDNEPLVTIGLPTYNRAPSLPRAISSALAQTYRNLELVISDNASTDGTQRLCREASEQDARVRYFRQPVNIGPTANFNAVLSAARGEFFMWLADDDWLDHSFVSECLRTLLERSDYTLVCGRELYYQGEQLRGGSVALNLLQESAEERVLAYYRQVGMNGTFYGLMRRVDVLKEPLPNVLAGDWLWLARLAFAGKVKTLESVAINRSCEGVSRDLRSLAAHYGLSEGQKRRPYHTIAITVFKDIAWQSPMYRSLGKIGRILLASRVTEIVGLRSFLPSWGFRTRITQALRAKQSSLPPVPRLPSSDK
jgi:glycosyltransferase involved in cell wall biosynthesis